MNTEKINWISIFFKTEVSHYFLVVFIVGMVALLCSPLANTQGYPVVSYIFLFVVSILAASLKVGPVFLASALSALVWNYFFIPPHFTFHIDKAEDILMFGVFFFIALVNGILTTRVKRQERLAIERESRTNALFQLTRELSKASGLDEVLKIARNEFHRNFGIWPFFILQDGNGKLNFSAGTDTALIPKENVFIAEWVFLNRRRAGARTDVFEDSELSFFPLPGNSLSPGVVAFKQEQISTEDQQHFWDAFLTQISNALEREFLVKMAHKAGLLVESDRLYKTLFNSISHELRIPVSTIIGATDELKNTTDNTEVNAALTNEIFMASIRLNRIIENLLNMSRLESGHLSIRLDWNDVNDLVNSVLDDLKDELIPFNVVVSIPDDVPPVRFDFGLMEQVLYNLLFNASQHAPPTSEIKINVDIHEEALIIEVLDKGKGFTMEALPNVFDKFYRLDSRKSGGLGLGLSIVKGFVEAHKGSVKAENRLDGGAAVIVSIPMDSVSLLDFGFLSHKPSE